MNPVVTGYKLVFDEHTRFKYCKVSRTKYDSPTDIKKKKEYSPSTVTKTKVFTSEKPFQCYSQIKSWPIGLISCTS